jgi:hypothetical protein
MPVTCRLATVLAALVAGCRDYSSEENLSPEAADKGKLDHATALEAELQKLRDAGIPTNLEELGLPDIPNEENGLRVYHQAWTILCSLGDKYGIADWGTHGELWYDISSDEKRRMLQDPDCVSVCRLLDQASQMKCQWWSKEDLADLRTMYFGRKFIDELPILRGLCRLPAYKARVDVEDGRIDSALESILTGLRMAKSLSSAPCILSHANRGALNNMSLGCLTEVLKRGGGSLSLYQQVMAELRKQRLLHLTQDSLVGEFIVYGMPVVAAYKKSDPGEFERELTERLELYKEGKENPQTFPDAIGVHELLKEFSTEEHWVDVATHGTDVLSGILAEFREKGPEKYWQEQELGYVQTVSDLILLTGKPYWEVSEEVAKCLDRFEELPLVAGGVQHAIYLIEAREDALLGAAELAIALKLYKARIDWYPIKLTQLVPDTISELPKDPFTGEDYEYSVRGESLVVYSLGENLQDDGGVSPWETRYRDISMAIHK